MGMVAHAKDPKQQPKSTVPECEVNYGCIAGKEEQEIGSGLRAKAITRATDPAEAAHGQVECILLSNLLLPATLQHDSESDDKASSDHLRKPLAGIENQAPKTYNGRHETAISQGHLELMECIYDLSNECAQQGQHLDSLGGVLAHGGPEFRTHSGVHVGRNCEVVAQVHWQHVRGLLCTRGQRGPQPIWGAGTITRRGWGPENRTDGLQCKHSWRMWY
mmetsp:Transcript_74283/g.131216  ORF Transcript_74283/g.131216 Transcript_74283/m.131216 type:complete len:219 (-) Transcript_74283:532-1188(-)